MRRDTGEIISAKEAADLNRHLPGIAIHMTIEPTEKQEQKRKVGKYDPSPRGSGKKLKFCCLLPSSKR